MPKVSRSGPATSITGLGAYEAAPALGHPLVDASVTKEHLNLGQGLKFAAVRKATPSWLQSHMQ